MVVKKERYKTGEKALTEKQVEEFLRYMPTVFDEALFNLALTSGIRREDIVAIKQVDVDLVNLEISFFENKKNRIWKVPISIEVAKKLKHHLVVIGKNEWLFPSPHGKGHITGRQVYNRLQKCLNNAGLPQRPFHALRATCIKLCQKKGWSVEQTARLVGDTIAVVQEHYSIPSPEELKQIMKERPIL